jgi:hypothetical protein
MAAGRPYSAEIDGRGDRDPCRHAEHQGTTHVRDSLGLETGCGTLREGRSPDRDRLERKETLITPGRRGGDAGGGPG